jgi:hypothetical protein
MALESKEAAVIAEALKDLGKTHEQNTRAFGERVKGVEVQVDSLKSVVKDEFQRVSKSVDKIATTQANCAARGGWNGIKERVNKLENKADRREDVTGSIQLGCIERSDQVTLKENEIKKFGKIIGWILGGVAGGAALSELLKGFF